MSSRWQANKIGLINFWYYDEQEFPFVKGKMLLRGSNGSGKSVTMQSVIPLLLDGDMSPERLDPFGSRDRKMVSYLLEEGDSREERTGYLYLEFKREDSPTYVTVGMGIRARRGRPLDKWYFGIQDGRRIGVDFQLYKDQGDKITLSRRELENRIGEGGQVFSRQAEYMAYVNRQIFGFNTLGQYREMINLLIQLRTPKLSRDFKPTVINDILSDSLQPLSDDDLRPMAEAIENMDTLQLNLEKQRKAYTAAQKIGRVFGAYNRKNLLEKTCALVACRQQAGQLTEKLEKNRKELERQEGLHGQAQEEKEKLQLEKKVREAQKEELSLNDAFALKEKSNALAEQEKQLQERLRGKKQQEATKQQREAKLKASKEQQDQELQKMLQQQSILLQEMEAPARTMGFEEHAFFEGEFQSLGPLDTSTHRLQVRKTEETLKQGTVLLDRIRVVQKELDGQLQKRDQLQKKSDQQERAVRNAQENLEQAISEWKEKLFSWKENCRELPVTREECAGFARAMDAYSREMDFSYLTQQVQGKKNQQFSVLEVQRNKLQAEQENQLAEKQKLEQEQLEWENRKEPEPEREECVLRNRRRLARMGISCQPLYQLLDFQPQVPETVCNHIEEALFRMGILDALVLPAEERERVMKPVAGLADRYLFCQKKVQGSTLLDVLQQEEHSPFQEQTRELLASIAWNGTGNTALREDGSYRLGLVEGTGTGEYQAGLIGIQAREALRQRKLQELEEQLAIIQTALEKRQNAILDIQNRETRLEDESQLFPREQEVRKAWENLEEQEHILERLSEERQEREQEIRGLHDSIQDKQEEARTLAGKLYLPCDYAAFVQAREACIQYQQLLIRLEGLHGTVMKSAERLQDLQSQLRDICQDRQMVETEAARLQLEEEKVRKNRENLETQLALTNYAEIRETLDACLHWLGTYEERLEECVRRIDAAGHAVEQLQQEQQELLQAQAALQGKMHFALQVWQDELALGYLPELQEKEEWTPEQVKQLLGKTKENNGNLIGSLNQVFYENNEYLSDYFLQFQHLFTEQEKQRQEGWPEAQRLNITAKYQGNRVAFPKLEQYLGEEIQHLEGLIRDQDRELFEDVLSNTVGRKIRSRIYESRNWVNQMNQLMGRMDTSSGLRLHLRWRARTAENEDELDTAELVELLKKDYRVMREEEAQKLNVHFRSKVARARRQAADSGGEITFYQVMKEALDYRKWFEFQLFTQKSGEKQRELTNSVFGTFSGGEKAMSMYVPLFSAVVARYQAAREDAPRLIALDEAFAGVDQRNIRDMFKLMSEFQFNFIINSQVLWGDSDTVDGLAIYQLLRPDNAKFVSVMAYRWDGKVRHVLDSARENETV